VGDLVTREKTSGIVDLIESMQIIAKYDNGTYSPTNCEHDKITLCAVNPYDVSEEDIKRLDELGWDQNAYPNRFDKEDPDWEPADRDEACFYSFRFGSC
jgi:hypothetical protein